VGVAIRFDSLDNIYKVALNELTTTKIDVEKEKKKKVRKRKENSFQKEDYITMDWLVGVFFFLNRTIYMSLI
jgi:hypothetical protein